ncbi:hypothetical protein BU14_2213s0002, partial [Porphyra umbilicalis]
PPPAGLGDGTAGGGGDTEQPPPPPLPPPRIAAAVPPAVAAARSAAPWALAPPAFTPALVGGKSLHLTALGERLPAGVGTPPSRAIPAGALSKVLAHGANAGAAAAYAAGLDRLDAAGGDAAAAVAAAAPLAPILNGLACPPALRGALRGVLADLGADGAAADARAPAAWAAVKRVWASVWGARAVLSRAKARIPHRAVAMAVLCQAVIDAEYAFVAHTTHPVSGDPAVAYVEVVVGLGEALVGNAPGSALGFTFRKVPDAGGGDGGGDGGGGVGGGGDGGGGGGGGGSDDDDNGASRVTVVTYPSKLVAITGGEYLFRSDSNAEDLDGFAGAGLYDSIPLVPTVEVPVDYGAERLVTDDAFREALCGRLGRLCVAVEAALGGPQDVEGCVKGGQLGGSGGSAPTRLGGSGSDAWRSGGAAAAAAAAAAKRDRRPIECRRCGCATCDWRGGGTIPTGGHPCPSPDGDDGGATAATATATAASALGRVGPCTRCVPARAARRSSSGLAGAP